MKDGTPKTVADYIAGYPQDVQVKLRKIRAVIRKAAPAAEEGISYQMPVYKLNGNLVYFAAFSNHISFFPTSSGVAKFQKELKAYGTTKGTIKFPLDKPIPYGLIARITKFRVKETLEKAKRKKKS